VELKQRQPSHTILWNHVLRFASSLRHFSFVQMFQPFSRRSGVRDAGRGLRPQYPAAGLFSLSKGGLQPPQRNWRWNIACMFFFPHIDGRSSALPPWVPKKPRRPEGGPGPRPRHLKACDDPFPCVPPSVGFGGRWRGGGRTACEGIYCLLSKEVLL